MASKTNNPKYYQNTGTTGFKRDTLSQDQWTAQYGFTAAQMAVDPDLQDLARKAWEGQWDKSRFDLELRETNWWKTKSKYARQYLMNAANPDSPDFQQLMQNSYEYVRKTARTMGVNLTDAKIRDLSVQSQMNGWYEQENAYQLERAILDSPSEGEYGGDIARNGDSLRALAYANGVQYDEGWFDSAGRSIAYGATDEQYWQDKIRQSAASMFPVFADQIAAGANVGDIASPYKRIMGEVLELNPNEITLNDPLILGALTNYSDKGQPYATNLSDFKRSLRRDPRWINTDAAQNEVTGLVGKMMQMFGVMS